jgi:plasmid stabilization system protein ParE
MDRRVIWTEAAWLDLEQVIRYIARDSPHYAASFAREVRDASRSLFRFAERGRCVPELSRQDIREIFVGSYRLVYSLCGETLHILGLIHGARELGAIWKREKRTGD